MSSENDIVLSVKNVSKCFEMYEKPVHRLYQTLCAGKRKFYREFWALRDINFEVRKGECVGIIGRNGAGKSTLLQIITGTLAPSTGEVKLKGRVAALLELGSGFNPEFTGRENVYLNGSILGLTKEEIDARYDEILAFADIGEFIDQPVKTYSSGMMVRLAFAVNASVEPDVLIVDEALAVGDAAFQHKCFMRMEALKKAGVTILFVTHDTETCKQFCGRVIFLRDHTISFDGDVVEGVTQYMRYLFPAVDKAEMPCGQKDGQEVQEEEKKPHCLVFSDFGSDCKTWGAGGAEIRCVRVFGMEPGNILNTPCRIRIEIDARWSRDAVENLLRMRDIPGNIIVGIRLLDVKNNPIFATNNIFENRAINPFDTEGAVVSYSFDLPALRPGEMFLTTAISVGDMPNHVDLVWHEMGIQFKCVSEQRTGGLIYNPVQTRISLT